MNFQDTSIAAPPEASAVIKKEPGITNPETEGVSKVDSSLVGVGAKSKTRTAVLPTTKSLRQDPEIEGLLTKFLSLSDTLGGLKDLLNFLS